MVQNARADEQMIRSTADYLRKAFDLSGIEAAVTGALPGTAFR
jgi:hypothetical protein